MKPRVFLGRDLTSANGKKKLAAIEAYWASYASRGAGAVVQQIIEENRPKGSSQPVLVQKTRMVLAAGNRAKRPSAKQDEIIRQQKQAVKLTAGRQFLFIAYADNRDPIQLFIVVDGKIAGADQRADLWFPNVAYTATTDAHADVYVVGPDKDIEYDLMVYVWKPQG